MLTPCTLDVRVARLPALVTRLRSHLLADVLPLSVPQVLRSREARVARIRLVGHGTFRERWQTHVHRAR